MFALAAPSFADNCAAYRIRPIRAAQGSLKVVG
jgi:hypothetical protein